MTLQHAREGLTYRALAVATLGALSLMTVSACGHTAATGARRTAPTAATVSQAGADAVPAGSISRPADPLAPPTVGPVVRDGRLPHPSLGAAPATFRQPVSYADGVSVHITSITQGTVSGQGPGVLTGQPTSTLTVRLDNGSSKALALNEVVVTTTYGTPARVAKPVYDEGVRDFSGTVSPGKSATAVYRFDIPTDQLAEVTVNIDFDGVHHAATFHGSVR